MKVYALSNVGKVRPLNEDSFYAPAGDEHFCCVADGMGGHNAGEVASAMAVETFSQQMKNLRLSPHERLRRAVSEANYAIYERGRGNSSMRGMGTTITALLVENGEAHIVHVGDSRCYLLRNRSLLQLTTDHTLVGELMAQGAITAKEAANHPQRNVITRALGAEGEIESDLLRVRLLPGDVFLLCSDGLYNCVSEHELTEILNSRMRRENKVSALIDRALDAGAPDNVTAMMVEVEEDVR